MHTIYTNCRYCESNCAVAVDVKDNKVVKISPDQKNPQTWKDVCSKGLTAQELVEHPARITAVMKRVGDQYIEVPYEQAIDEIAAQLQGLINKNGKDAVGYYYGNPLGFSAGLTFSLGFFEGLGTNNRYSVGSIDQNNNHVVTHKVFGHQFIPMNPDVENSDYMLLIGMNPAESKFSWLGAVSNGWEKARTAMKERGAKVVVVDPRRTTTAAQASEHVTIKPGNDWALLLGLVKVIFAEELYDQQSLNKLAAEQIDQLKTLSAGVELSTLSQRCGIPSDKIQEIARDYAKAKAAMCLTQTGVSMHDTGTIGHWLGLVLDIITGHLAQKGGRHWEPGYVNLSKFAKDDMKPETVSRVRQQPTVMGYRSLAEMPDEINAQGPGQMKALIMQCGNPVISGPDGKALEQAMDKLDLIISVDLLQRESHKKADWLIPGVHWLERGELNTSLAGGMDTPLAQYSAQALQPPEGVHQEWEFFMDLALKMQVPMLGRKGVNTTVRFSRWLAKVFNKPDWAFSPLMLSKLMLLADKKVSWKQLQENPHGVVYADKAYGQLDELLKNAGESIQIAPAEFVAELKNLLSVEDEVDSAYPFTMIGKRNLSMMNSWQMDLPNMQKREQSNCCELHPEDAKALGITDGDKVKISSPLASIELNAKVCDRLQPGIVCIQHGWGSSVFNPKASNEISWQGGVNKNVLIDNKRIDPFSGIPNLNSTRVNIERL